MVADGDALLAGLEIWLADQISSTREAIAEAGAQMEQHRETAVLHERARQDALLVERGQSDLRQPPLSDDEFAELGLHADGLDLRRQHLDAGVEALEYLCHGAEALTWEEAPRRLDETLQLVPGLEAQLREAEAFQSRAEREVSQAEARYDEANSRFLLDQLQPTSRSFTSATLIRTARATF